MFTGIIEEIGRIEQLRSLGEGVRLSITAPRLGPQLSVNDSISINGVCQTVVDKRGHAFDVVAVEETLKKTTFSGLSERDAVNLELPMKLDGRFGGHLVLGHVDTVGSVDAIEQRENSWMFTISFPAKFQRYIVPVGSVCVDGVSLTVAELHRDAFKVSIIPHTMENTIFQHYRKKSDVNLEFDVVGKYVERLLAGEGTADGRRLFIEQYPPQAGT